MMADQDSPLGMPLDNARYRHLVEQSGDMISTHRPGDWAYTTINPALVEVCGYTADELLGRPAYDFFHPDDAQAMKRRMIPAIYQHGVRTFRYRSRHKNGRYFWLESTHRSIRDPESNELIEIISVTRDITKQVKAESASKRLAQILEVSSDLVMFCDPTLRVNYMNPSALAGFSIAQFEGANLESLLAEDSVTRLREIIFPQAKKEGAWRGEIRLKSPRFSKRFMILREVLIHVSTDGLDDQEQYSLIVMDLTRQAAAERESRHHQSELAHANRLSSLGEMASGLAHEINQPLATALNYASGAISQIDNGKLNKVQDLTPVLEKIALQAQRAAGIVKRLRSLVKKTPYQRQEFLLNPVCLDVVDFIRHELRKAGVNVVCRLADEELMLEADRIQLEQVLINLLRNALDAHEGLDADHPPIEMITSGDAENVFIEVLDYGKGMEPDYLEELFKPYVTSKPQGLGMGLSITRTIVETHGGAIDVESRVATPEKSGFTRFSIRLPKQGK
jgi:two-component system sensor kinase FixL